MTRAEAEANWAKHSEAERVQYVGEKLIGRYGCFGCHDIPGFEKAQPIGVELSKHADKPLFQLDFGFVDIHHGRRDFFAQKLADPRIYDMGRVKPPQDKLKMPQFDFTEDEIELMTMNLLGFTKETVPITKIPEKNPVQIDTEEGWWLVHERNCIGCHSFDGYGGAIAATLPDPALAPPMIRREGAKVNPDWLFRFLKEPSSIRPWLSTRMPTFHFDDPTASDLVKYFVALEDETLRFRTPMPVTTAAADLSEGAEQFRALQCQKCHVVGEPAPGRHACRLGAGSEPGARAAASRLDRRVAPRSAEVASGHPHAQLLLLLRRGREAADRAHAGRRAEDAPRARPCPPARRAALRHHVPSARTPPETELARPSGGESGETGAGGRSARRRRPSAH